jgi:hypothetical protein
VLTPDRFEPVIVPVDATDVGVIAPKPIVRLGVVDEFVTKVVIPCVPFAEKDVTVPMPPLTIGTFTTLVIRPLLSTINCGTVVADPYVLAVTPVVDNDVAKLPVPEPVISPLKAIVWSPVFTPDKFVPVTVPVDVTDVGVIAPSVKVIAGVDVGLATTPLTPLADTTDTVVTDPKEDGLFIKSL